MTITINANYSEPQGTITAGPDGKFSFTGGNEERLRSLAKHFVSVLLDTDTEPTAENVLRLMLERMPGHHMTNASVD